MLPVLQLCLEGLEQDLPVLSDLKLITVFIAADMPLDLTENGSNWLIRIYTNMEDLKFKELSNPDSFIKPFPLKAELIEEDYPVWDGGGLSAEMDDKFLELERVGVIEDYYDVTQNHYGHKLGGYPSFCQPGEGIHW